MEVNIFRSLKLQISDFQEGYLCRLRVLELDLNRKQQARQQGNKLRLSGTDCQFEGLKRLSNSLSLCNSTV